MKIKSISGLTLQVTNLDQSIAFYEGLGLRLGKREDDRATMYINWFWVELVLAHKNQDPDVQNVLFNASVQDVDDFYQFVLDLGHKPESQPADQPTGRREFVLFDPAGYKLNFFQK